MRDDKLVLLTDTPDARFTLIFIGKMSSLEVLSSGASSLEEG
jgi:hypothetical protein